MSENERMFLEIRKETWVIFLIRTTNSVGFSATIPFLAVYLNAARSVPLSEIGLIYLISGILGLGSQVMGGRLTDSIGPKKVMLTAYTSSFFFSVILGYLVLISANVVTFFVTYPAFSLIRGISQPASSSIIAGQQTSEVRTGFSLLNIGGNLGFAIGPAMGGIVASSYDYASVFAISAGASIIALFITASWVRGGRRFSSEDLNAITATGEKLSHKLGKNTILFLSLIFCLFFCVGYEIIPLSLYSSHFLHLSNDLIGYLFATNGLVIVILQLPLTKVMEKSRRILLPLVIACVLAAFSFLIASLSGDFIQLELMMFVITLAEIFLTVPSQTIIAMFSRAGNRGTYQGYYSAVSSAGRSVASFVGPLTFSLFAFDPALSWYLVLAFAILTMIGFLLLSPSIQKEYEKLNPSSAPKGKLNPDENSSTIS